MNKRNRVTHQTTHIRHTSDKVECVSDVWEERWLEVMETFTTSADKIRLVEGSGPLARAFLTLPVTMTPFHLHDAQMCFRLRDLVGSLPSDDFVSREHPMIGFVIGTKGREALSDVE